MRAKANNYTGAGMEERYTASNDRGSKKDSDNTKLRYIYTLVIVSVIMSVANILLDLRYTPTPTTTTLILCNTYIIIYIPLG